jgi:hypothetical protein
VFNDSSTISEWFTRFLGTDGDKELDDADDETK